MATRPVRNTAYGLTDALLNVAQAPIVAHRNPTIEDRAQIGTEWINETDNLVFVLTSIVDNEANWLPIGEETGANTFDADSGSATPSSGVINLHGGTNINTAASGNTVVFNLDSTISNITIDNLTLGGLTEGVLVVNNSGVVSSDATTNHSLLIGNSTGTITSLGVATNGEIPIGSTGNNPVLATITAGTGISVTNGSGSITIAATGSVPVIDGDAGSASGSPLFLITGYGGHGPIDASGTPQFNASSNEIVLTFTDGTGNTIIGTAGFSGGGSPGGTDNTGLGDLCMQGAGGGFTGSFNCGVGAGCLEEIQGANNNTATGYDSGTSLSTGGNNCFYGFHSGNTLTTGANNVFIGYESGGAVISTITGSYNVEIGYEAGVNYTTSESSNILINASSTSVVSESNVLRIGNGTGSGNQQLAKAFISGINGVNVGSVASVVSISGNQLGSTTITAGTGISVTPGANTITIANTGGVAATTLIQTQTVSGVADVVFTTGLTSTYNNYLVIFNTTIAQTGSAFYLMTQLSTNGGSTYIATGYLTQASGPTTGLGGAQSLTSNNGGTGVFSGNLYLNDLTAGTATDFPGCVSSFTTWDGATGINGAAISSIYTTASTTVNAIKILLSNGGNMTGTFSLYGYVH